MRRVDGHIYQESYDKLLLALGGTPFIPNIPGMDSLGIFTLCNIENADAIKNIIDTNEPKTAVVIGGFISLEMAKNLHALGIQVSIIERAPQVIS